MYHFILFNESLVHKELSEKSGILDVKKDLRESLSYYNILKNLIEIEGKCKKEAKMY